MALSTKMCAISRCESRCPEASDISATVPAKGEGRGGGGGGVRGDDGI